MAMSPFGDFYSLNAKLNFKCLRFEQDQWTFVRKHSTHLSNVSARKNETARDTV